MSISESEVYASERRNKLLGFPSPGWKCVNSWKEVQKSMRLQEQATDATPPMKICSAPSPIPPSTVPDSLQHIWRTKDQNSKNLKASQ